MRCTMCKWHSRQANMGYENILDIWFSHFTLTGTLRGRIIPCRRISIKKILRVDPFTRQSKPSLKLLHSAPWKDLVTFISIHMIANQNSYHDDKLIWQCFTCLLCPRLVRNVLSRRCFDSSSIIAHPVNFDKHSDTAGVIKCDANN